VFPVAVIINKNLFIMIDYSKDEYYEQKRKQRNKQRTVFFIIAGSVFVLYLFYSFLSYAPEERSRIIIKNFFKQCNAFYNDQKLNLLYKKIEAGGKADLLLTRFDKISLTNKLPLRCKTFVRHVDQKILMGDVNIIYAEVRLRLESEHKSSMLDLRDIILVKYYGSSDYLWVDQVDKSRIKMIQRPGSDVKLPR